MKNLEFEPQAFEDLAWWIAQDRKKALKIVKLLEDIQRHPLAPAKKLSFLKKLSFYRALN